MKNETEQPENPRRQWSTPQILVEDIELRLGVKFELDVAASEKNAKAPEYYDVSANGLTQPWTGNVWCQPPYDEIKQWVWRALDLEGQYNMAAALLASRTDQAWFHDCLKYAQAVFFFDRRIPFVAPDATIKMSSNREPSILAVFNGAASKKAKIYTYDLGNVFPRRRGVQSSFRWERGAK